MFSLFHPIPKPKSGQIRVACVGDSITYGYRVRNRRKNCYPAQLNRLLGDGYCVGNFGFSGRTATESGDRPYTKTRLFHQSLAWKPDIVLLMLGTNDSKPQNWNAEDYKRDMERLIDTYRELGSQVLLLLPLPVYPVNGAVKFDISASVLEGEILPICRTFAAQKRVTVIDTHSAFLGCPGLYADGVHPNSRGTEQLAKTIYKSLMKREVCDYEPIHWH